MFGLIVRHLLHVLDTDEKKKQTNKQTKTMKQNQALIFP